MKKDKTLRELISKSTTINSETLNNLTETTNSKRKGIDIVEIDNDNGMCMYDYLYNDM